MESSTIIGAIALIIAFIQLIITTIQKDLVVNKKKKDILNFLRKNNKIQEFFSEINWKIPNILFIVCYFLGISIPVIFSFLLKFHFTTMLMILPTLSVFLIGILSIIVIFTYDINKNKFPKFDFLRLEKWNLFAKGISIFFSGVLVITIADLFLLIYIIPPNFPGLSNYPLLVSYLTIISALFILSTEMGFVKPIEKELTTKIRKKAIKKLRNSNISVISGVSGSTVEGILWDIGKNGLLLKRIGDNFVFWNEISWIEVIEENQNNRTKEKRIRKNQKQV